MTAFIARKLSPKLLTPLASVLLALTSPALAADEVEAKGAAVSVIRATKVCFADIVEVFGIVVPRDEMPVRPDRAGLKVIEVLVEPGDNVTAGQVLARAAGEGGAVQIQAPVAGLVSSSSAITGASAKGEALFSIIARGEFDLVGLLPARDMAKLAVNQAARIKISGAGEVDGKLRQIASSVEPNSQLGRVFIALTASGRFLVNSSARAKIKTGESCGLAVPLSAVLYESTGTVVRVVRRARVETRRVELGLMSAGQVEIRDGLQEGDAVVARAGALLREGDTVRPVAGADGK
jgi:HlyD family secretion protein